MKLEKAKIPQKEFEALDVSWKYKVADAVTANFKSQGLFEILDKDEYFKRVYEKSLEIIKLAQKLIDESDFYEKDAIEFAIDNYLNH